MSNFFLLINVTTILLLIFSANLVTSLETYTVVLVDNPYIVEVESNSKLRKTNDANSWRKKQILHHDDILSSLKPNGAKLRKLYSFKNVINGFSAQLTKSQAKKLKERDDVLSVTKQTIYTLSLTYTPRFLDNIGVSYGAMYSSSTGKDVVIGIIDTGIWPESPYFKDDRMGSIPKKFKGRCVNDTRNLNVVCNKKIIGAKYFNKGYLTYPKDNLPVNVSTRDVYGHGTSVASIAAGNPIANTSIDSAAFGSSNGIAYNARLAIYKACWALGPTQICASADVVAALDEGVKDKVDLFSASLGGTQQVKFKDDPIYFATLNAVVAGIPVVMSAGNDGKGKVQNGYPWVMTVGASTIDRAFQNTVLLNNYISVKGQTSTGGTGNTYAFIPLIEAASAFNLTKSVSRTNADYCMGGSLNSTMVKGKIVLCIDGYNSRAEKSQTVKQSGGRGVIIYTLSTFQEVNGVDLNNYYVPTSYVDYKSGIYIRNFIRSQKNPMASLSGINSIFGKSVSSAPRISAFSSTGPNFPSPYLIKPDIVAPGENIITAWSGSPEANILSNGNPTSFRIVSGTSVATPHVAGAVAMIKAAHPDWPPSWIYSAIITTGWTLDNQRKSINDSNNLQAMPFQMGGGHIYIEAALDPGLVFPINGSDYRKFLCTPTGGYNPKARKGCISKLNETNFNFPYLVIPDLRSNFTTKRTLQLVAWPAIYQVQIVNPAGARILVSPSRLDFSKSKTWTFNITVVPLSPYYNVNAAYDLAYEHTFGSIAWSDGFHTMKMNVAVSIVLID